MPTGTWPNLQNAKQQYLKFRLGTCVPPSPPPESLLLTLCLFMCNIPQGRAGGVAVLMDLLDGSRQFLVAAEDR